MKLCKVYFKSKENKSIVYLPSGCSIEFVNISEGVFYHYTIDKGNRKVVVMVDVVKERT